MAPARAAVGDVSAWCLLALLLLSPTLFAMLVVMALVTTLATTPVLRLFYRPPAGSAATAA
jgi:hypothetical protein